MREWQEDLEELFGAALAPPADEDAEPRPAKRLPASRAPRGRRTRRRRRLTRRALAARRANLRKARAAPKELIYRSTPKRQVASRANLQKAQAARRSPRGNAAARLNALKHGMFAYATLGESVRRLAENPREFAAHRRRFARLFVPEGAEEEQLVKRLAEACWRRLRLFRAAARWETERLKEVLARAPRLARLDADETQDRATALVLAFFYTYEAVFRESDKLNSQIEALLRALLRKRSGGEVEFRLFSPRRDPKGKADELELAVEEAEAAQLRLDEFLRRLQALPPEVQAKPLPPRRE